MIKIIENIKYKYINIRNSIKDYITGIKNIFIFHKVIRRWRWWDYSFTYDFILMLVKELEKHWEKDTHYVGSEVEKDKLTYIVKRLEELRNKDDWESMNGDIDEELGKVGYQLFKMIRSLWD